MTISVRTRLALWLIAGVAALLIVAALMLLAVHDRVALQRLDAELRRITETVGAVLQNELDEKLPPREAAEDALSEVRLAERHVAIFTAAGDLLAARWTLPSPPIANRQDESSTIQTPVRARVMSRQPTVPRGYVVVTAANWDELDRQRRDLFTSIAVLWPPALVFTVGVLIWVSRGLFDQLERSHDARRRFLIDASHELRTPVSVARTAADLALSRPMRDAGEYREALVIVARQMRHMTRLLGDMLMLARNDASEWPVIAEEYYLDELVEQVTNDMRVLAAPRQVVIEVSCPKDFQHRGDQMLLRQMLTNLVENAVRHSATEGVVRVAVAREAEAVVILVTNGGEGVRPDDRDRIFEPFVRVGRSGDDGGLGLGLAIVRRIARLHGGEASLAASGPDTTTFAVRLPANA